MTDVPASVARVLAAMESGDWTGVATGYADDVVFDGSVPAWRFQIAGREAVVAEVSGWTAQHAWRIVEQRVTPTSRGVLVELEVRGQCPGDADHEAHEEASRSANIFELDAAGLIVEQRLVCCGEWGEEEIARIEAEAPKVLRA